LAATKLQRPAIDWICLSEMTDASMESDSHTSSACWLTATALTVSRSECHPRVGIDTNLVGSDKVRMTLMTNACSVLKWPNGCYRRQECSCSRLIEASSLRCDIPDFVRHRICSVVAKTLFWHGEPVSPNDRVVSTPSRDEQGPKISARR
jgi:hypothetical protein